MTAEAYERINEQNIQRLYAAHKENLQKIHDLEKRLNELQASMGTMQGNLSGLNARLGVLMGQHFSGGSTSGDSGGG